MALETLLACMRIGHSNADLLAVVGDVARRFGSSVIGVAAKQVATRSYMGGAGPCMAHRHDLQRFRERASAAEEEFRAALSNVETLEWRTQETLGPVYEHIVNEARSADLVVARLDRHDRLFSPTGQAEVADLLMRVGRPILAVPPGAQGLKLDSALVYWEDTRETRRAVADALPLLQASKAVHVVEIVDIRSTDAARRRLADLGDWLARHGVKATCAPSVSAGVPARQLLSIAGDLEADLIVAGAYGNSRLREWAFGGVTRDLLLLGERCLLAAH